jgi:hypothetical protein
MARARLRPMFTRSFAPGDGLMRGPIRVIVVGLVTTLIAGSAPAADTCYVSVFTAESVPFRSTHTHTFVVAVWVPESGPADVAHISWFPANMRQRGLTLLPEPGTNLGLADTFAVCRARGMRVSLWGPYRAEPELFDIINRQAAHLESGRVLYKPTDNVYPSDVAANCYHAIWRPVAPCRKYSGLFNCGDVTGGNTVRLFSPWLIDPCRTHDTVLEVFVPAGEPVVRRAFDDRPTRVDSIRSAVGR